MPTAVILTAVALEYEAVRSLLTDMRRREHPSGTRFDTGVLPGSSWEIAVAEMGERNAAAGLIVEQAIAWLHPRALFFVGFAGGLRTGVNVGDVVVATRLYGLQSDTRSQSRSLVEPDGFPATHRLEQAARAALRSGWNSVRGDAVVHFGPVAAVRGTHHTDAEQALSSHPDALAVELSSTGLSCCHHLVGSCARLTIRGITDTEVHRQVKSVDHDTRPAAAANAASAAAAVLTELSPWDDPRNARL